MYNIIFKKSSSPEDFDSKLAKTKKIIKFLIVIASAPLLWVMYKLFELNEDVLALIVGVVWILIIFFIIVKNSKFWQ